MSRFNIISVLLVILILLQITMGCGKQKSEEESLNPIGTIAFVTERDGNREIYMMNANGSSQTRLTWNIAADSVPALLWNGDKISYSTMVDYLRIFVSNNDGSNKINIGYNAISNGDLTPAWVANGTALLFHRAVRVDTLTVNDEIYFMNADGSGIKPLEEYAMASDGINATKVTKNWSNTDPTISQEKFYTTDPYVAPFAKIAFVSNRDGNPEIYTWDYIDIPKDNPNLGKIPINATRLTNSVSKDIQPVWSPSISKTQYIAFVSDRDGDNEIYSISYTLKGSGVYEISQPKQLTNNNYDDNSPCWSPDGSMICFSSNASGHYEIYVMMADGTKITQITDDKSWNGWPSWGA